MKHLAFPYLRILTGIREKIALTSPLAKYPTHGRQLVHRQSDTQATELTRGGLLQPPVDTGNVEVLLDTSHARALADFTTPLPEFLFLPLFPSQGRLINRNLW